MKVKGQICTAYFKGIDGLGTCDDECQWYHKGTECPCSETRDSAKVGK